MEDFLEWLLTRRDRIAVVVASTLLTLRCCPSTERRSGCEGRSIIDERQRRLRQPRGKRDDRKEEAKRANNGRREYGVCARVLYPSVPQLLTTKRARESKRRGTVDRVRNVCTASRAAVHLVDSTTATQGKVNTGAAGSEGEECGECEESRSTLKPSVESERRKKKNSGAMAVGGWVSS